MLLLFLFLMFLLKPQQTKRGNLYSMTLKVFFWTELEWFWKGLMGSKKTANQISFSFCFFLPFFSLYISSLVLPSCYREGYRVLQLEFPRHVDVSHPERSAMARHRVFFNESVCYCLFT